MLKLNLNTVCIELILCASIEYRHEASEGDFE